jgi:hypothetical protein
MCIDDSVPRHLPSITQENKLGQRFIEASDFLKMGVPASILATIVRTFRIMSVV